MKTTPMLLSALAIVGAADAGAQEEARPAETTVVTLKVSGMSCSVCAGTIERTAKRLPGVIDVKASQPKGVAEVTYDAAKTTAEEIAKFIAKNSGFQAEAPKR